MKSFVVFDASGEIKLSGRCPDADLLNQGPTGYVIEAQGNLLTHYVVNSELVAYTDVQAAIKQAAPLYPATWSNETMQWTDLRSLADIKFQKWEEIKNTRAAKCAEILTVGAWTFDATGVSQQQINGAVTLALLAPSDWTIDWTLGDNTTATLTKAEMISVGVALGARTSAIYAAGRVIREAIEAATTAAEVEAITWV